ncbi:MAG: helix-turn-helix domain-containing protein [Oscillospiraceae bacterium]|nr:helix-turn-helix domain-containing protein [Oscillospiraceae bacterium]
MERIGELLTELREKKGLTQLQVSKLTHISNSAISAYETGARYPKLDVLSTLSKVYGVTTDYLLGLSPSDISPSVLTEEFVDGISYGEVLHILSTTKPAERKFVLRLILAARERLDIDNL